MKDWRPSTWGDEVSLEYGKALRGYQSASGPVRVFGSNGPVGWTDKALAKGPGVILGRKGAYRGVQYSEGDFFVIDTAYYVVPKTDLDMRWLYYAIKYHKLGEIDDGSPIPSTTRAAVYVRDLEVPPRNVQEDIARVLGSIDDKIELNRQINQTLEEMAQAIFKSWFVDFEPVKAKVEAKVNGQDPERAAMCAISGKTEEELDQLPPDQLAQLRTTAALFPDELTDSELGPIPNGWKLSPLGKQCDILNGHAFKSNDYVNEGIFVFRTKNFSDSGYSERLPDDVYLPEKFSESHSQFLCEPFDFHVVMVAASIGKTATILPHHLPALRNQNMWCFRAKQSFPSKIFLNHIVSEIVGEVIGWATGSARSFFRKGDFQNQTIILPDFQLLSAFESLVSPMRYQISTNDLESTNLAQIRDTLLPKLLSGEIEIGSTPISS